MVIVYEQHSTAMSYVKSKSLAREAVSVTSPSHFQKLTDDGIQWPQKFLKGDKVKVTILEDGKAITRELTVESASVGRDAWNYTLKDDNGVLTEGGAEYGEDKLKRARA